jgi:glycosyltransferase involved in cell wall biosynthesis
MAALAHGMPIISTYPQIHIPEIIEGVNVSLAPPSDPEALADRIRELAASDELRERLALGAAGLSRLFSWESIAESTKQLYERMLSAGE